MKLFCICGHCSEKITLQNKTATRQQLASQIGYTFNITCNDCRRSSQGNVNIVNAESSYKYAQASGIVGAGGVGAFFGPLGLIIGVIVGAASGTGVKNSDKTEVNRFNNS